jgi:cytochrome bd-type quinol oxidase subunit 2
MISEINKSYFGMLWRLFTASIVLALVYAVFAIVIIICLKLLLKEKKDITLPAISIGVLGHIFQLYIWLLWVSFCVYLVKYFINSSTVTQSWFYYLTGFIASVFLLTLLDKGLEGLNRRQSLNSLEKLQLIIVGPNISYLLIIVSFILFCIYPNLMNNKFLSIINERCF